MIEMNTYHLTHIKADFLKNTGKRVAFLSKLPITYKSSKYARESFNADTVITYPLKMWEKYENKYIMYYSVSRPPLSDAGKHGTIGI